jgi:cell division protein FtsQ
VIDDRIAQRRAQVRDDRRRRRLRRTITIIVLLVLAVVLVFVERSALVGLEEVRVEGIERLTALEVERAAGLELGTSTLRLGLRAAETRVEALPLVRAADARRLDPLTVVIEVTERVPTLNVVGDDGDVLVDRDGVVLVDGEVEGLPIIELPAAPPEPGGTVADDPALDNAYRVWRSLSGPLRTEVEVYEAEAADVLTLRMRSGVEVRFGRAERVDEKVRALGAVLEDVGDTEVTVIDVRAPSAPVVIGP